VDVHDQGVWGLTDELRQHAELRRAVEDAVAGRKGTREMSLALPSGSVDVSLRKVSAHDGRDTMLMLLFADHSPPEVDGQ
jgi:hypothetical protein